MRIPKSNSIKNYIKVVVAIMVILQVILIYGVISDIVYQIRNKPTNEVTAESKESSKVLDTNFLTQESKIGIDVGKVTLIGVLMVGTGLLLSVEEKDSEKRPEENTH